MLKKKRKILLGFALSLFLFPGLIKQAFSEEVKIHLFSPPIIEAGSQVPLSWIIQGGEVTKTQAFWRLIPQEDLSEILKSYQSPKTYTSGEFSFDSSLYTKGKEFSGEHKIHLDDTFTAPSLSEDSPPFIRIIIYAAVDGIDYYTFRIIRIIKPQEENSLSESRTSTSSDPEETREIEVKPESVIVHSYWGGEHWWFGGGEYSYGPFEDEWEDPGFIAEMQYMDSYEEWYFDGVLKWTFHDYREVYSKITFEIPQIEPDEEIVCAILSNFCGGPEPKYFTANGSEGQGSCRNFWFDIGAVEPGSSVTITVKATGAPFDYEDEWDGEYHHGWGVYAMACALPPTLTLHIATKKLVEKYGRKCLCPCYNFLSTLNLSNGNLYFEKEIISTPGTGLTTNLTLSYNSLDSYTGPLGKGFTHNYNLNLKESADTITLMTEDGERIKFVLTEDNKYEPQDNSGDHSTIVKNPDATYLLTRKYGTQYLFDSSAKLTRIEDRNGNLQTFDYDALGNLITIVDSSGRITTLFYTENKITSVTNSAGKTTTFEYDGDNLIKITDPLGNTFSYSYDENNRMITKTDPKGNFVTYTYDEKGRVTTGKLNDEPSHTITYDEENNKGAATDPQGNATTYSYDKELNALTGLEDSEGNITTNTFDENRNLTTTTDQEANTTSYTYDEKGNLLTLTDPEDNTTTYTYETTYNQIASITDSLSNKASYGYDDKGNLTSITDPDNKTTGYAYDEKGNLISITNPEGQSTSFEYDEHGNLSQITDNLGNITSFTYDASGNMLSRTDPAGNTTFFEYNELNQLIKITDPAGNTTIFTYDANGNRTSSTDALSNTTSYEYNGKNQLIKVTDSKGGITQYGYDSVGNRTSITDANGNTTTYAYDSLNRLISETDPEGNAISYSYDVKGNLISRTDANGITTNYTYNSLNRLTQTLYPEDLYVNYSYDSLNNLTHFDDNINNLSVDYSYDKLSRLTKLDIASKGAISYEYDSLGNRIKMIDPEGKITTYSYDELNRLISLTNPDTQTTSYEYDKLGRKVRMSYPNNTYATYSYDKRGNLINLTNYGRDAKIISSYSYTYDALGNRLTNVIASKTKQSHSYYKKRGDTISYEYDSLYQLTQAKGSKGWNINYDYDPVGNRVVARFIGPAADKKIHPLTEVNYSYNSANQLIKEEQVVGKGAIPIKTIDYGYDGNGNQVLKYMSLRPLSKAKGKQSHPKGEAISSFAYDPENRLTGITYTSPHIFKKGTRTNNFAYCPFGKRIFKSDSTGDMFYFYDGDNILLELDAQNKTLARYTTGLGIDEWISKTTYSRKKAKTIYYHYDGLGSVVALTDEKGNVVKKYNYSPFGTLVPQGIASPYLAPAREKIHNYFPPSRRNTITYTGREYDPDSGLYFYRARYYDSRVGRFLQKDPMRSVNPYIYCLNNPVNYTDPEGLDCNDFINGTSYPGCEQADCQDCCDQITPPVDFENIGRGECYKVCAKGRKYFECLVKCYKECEKKRLVSRIFCRFNCRLDCQRY